MMRKQASIIVIIFSLVVLVFSSTYASGNPEYTLKAKSSMENEYSSSSSLSRDNEYIDAGEYSGLIGDNNVSLQNLYRKSDDAYPTNSAFRAFLNNENGYDELFEAVRFDFSRNSDVTTGFDVGMPSGVNDFVSIGAAFLTNLTAHEFGHEIVAGHVGAKGSELNFFKKKDGSFFLGTSTVESIEAESKLPYHMGGEVFADMTFEHALKEYREKPTTFNKALLVFSGTDFLWYSMYSFYLSDGHTNFDPISIHEETGLAKDTLFTLALAKTAINAHRIYSGKDYVIPYFTVNKESASVKFVLAF